MLQITDAVLFNPVQNYNVPPRLNTNKQLPIRLGIWFQCWRGRLDQHLFPSGFFETLAWPHRTGPSCRPPFCEFPLLNKFPNSSSVRTKLGVQGGEEKCQ
ncbi:hypothetical protein T02_7463 [Trichinella nativa]|uniref:Uncharacterized protein n=1 Tax=Trichinella nativa TaxID=6335 RepID=A0A0V1LJ34_9BILA|nr:hypothetical protein T02_7463 [Trichinella nativa]KRZ92269.1 hypothetical protein T08_473 [Trichinella sp. T8]